MKRFIVTVVAMNTLLIDADTLEDASQLAIARANNLKKVDWWVNGIDLFENGDDDDCDCEDDDDDDNQE